MTDCTLFFAECPGRKFANKKGGITRGNRAESRSDNDLAPLSRWYSWSIASQLSWEDQTHRAQTGLLDFKWRQMVASFESCQSRPLVVPEFTAEVRPRT